MIIFIMKLPYFIIILNNRQSFGLSYKGGLKALSYHLKLKDVEEHIS
jgi:hypothetical protein